MDVKDLRTDPALSERGNNSSNGNINYAHSSPSFPSTDKNKSYHDIGSNSLPKVDVHSTRPCAVIGPDRIIPPPQAVNDAYNKRGHVEPWQLTRPPEYSLKMTEYQQVSRNISPRQTFQENMQRIMVPPRSLKLPEDTNFTTEKNAVVKSSTKVNMPTEAKYCDVPYTVNPLHNEPKITRNSEHSNVNPTLMQGVPHAWPPPGTNVHPPHNYGAPNPYHYPDYTNCAAPRAAPVIRSLRPGNEDTTHMYTDPYRGGNIRYEPYPTMKDRNPMSRYEYFGNYSNPYPPPMYPTYKHDVQKLPATNTTMPHHPYPGYSQVPPKYLRDPIKDGYQRSPNPQTNFNVPYNQNAYAMYGSVPGNCLQSKLYTYPQNGTLNASNPKTLYDMNTKPYVKYDNIQTKHYPGHENLYLNDIQRSHIKPSMGMPGYPSVNMHPLPPYPYYRKENMPMRSFDYSAHYKPNDPLFNTQMSRIPSQFSPNIISPVESNTSNDNHGFAVSPEDCGYVSQSSTTSVRSTDSMYRVYDPRYGYMNRASPIITRSESDSKTSGNKDKKGIDVRQFLQMWNEGEEEHSESHTNKDAVMQAAASDGKQCEVVSNQDQLYVLGLVNVPSEELSKYEHIQKVSKLPENIKGYTSIDLLNQFEEAIGSSSINDYPVRSTDTKQIPALSKTNFLNKTPNLPTRPLSPLDVEAKISQSVIHKEVGCNFEIKPCSPKMLNVEAAAPAQTLLDERAIEKVNNRQIVSSPQVLSNLDNNSSNCHVIKRQDRTRPLNRESNTNNPSCKMIKTQFSNDVVEEPEKSNYTIQDLESNSGVCLASLPRLDNDIELSFPEVNQQFINANKAEPVTTIEMETDSSASAISRESTEVKSSNSNPFSPNSKEFLKLSKYRKVKNKESTENSHATAKVIRTDSVIIKNPDTNVNVTDPKESRSPISDHTEDPETDFHEPLPINLAVNNNEMASETSTDHNNFNEYCEVSPKNDNPEISENSALNLSFNSETEKNLTEESEISQSDHKIINKDENIRTSANSSTSAFENPHQTEPIDSNIKSSYNKVMESNSENNTEFIQTCESKEESNQSPEGIISNSEKETSILENPVTTSLNVKDDSFDVIGKNLDNSHDESIKTENCTKHATEPDIEYKLNDETSLYKILEEGVNDTLATLLSPLSDDSTNDVSQDSFLNMENNDNSEESDNEEQCPKQENDNADEATCSRPLEKNTKLTLSYDRCSDSTKDDLKTQIYKKCTSIEQDKRLDKTSASTFSECLNSVEKDVKLLLNSVPSKFSTINGKDKIKIVEKLDAVITISSKSNEGSKTLTESSSHIDILENDESNTSKIKVTTETTKSLDNVPTPDDIDNKEGKLMPEKVINTVFNLNSDERLCSIETDVKALPHDCISKQNDSCNTVNILIQATDVSFTSTPEINSNDLETDTKQFENQQQLEIIPKSPNLDNKSSFLEEIPNNGSILTHKQCLNSVEPTKLSLDTSDVPEVVTSNLKILNELPHANLEVDETKATTELVTDVVLPSDECSDSIESFVELFDSVSHAHIPKAVKKLISDSDKCIKSVDSDVKLLNNVLCDEDFNCSDNSLYEMEKSTDNPLTLASDQCSVFIESDVRFSKSTHALKCVLSPNSFNDSKDDNPSYKHSGIADDKLFHGKRVNTNEKTEFEDDYSNEQNTSHVPLSESCFGRFNSAYVAEREEMAICVLYASVTKKEISKEIKKMHFTSPHSNRSTDEEIVVNENSGSVMLDNIDKKKESQFFLCKRLYSPVIQNLIYFVENFVCDTSNNSQKNLSTLKEIHFTNVDNIKEFGNTDATDDDIDNAENPSSDSIIDEPVTSSTKLEKFSRNFENNIIETSLSFVPFNYSNGLKRHLLEDAGQEIADTKEESENVIRTSYSKDVIMNEDPYTLGNNNIDESSQFNRELFFNYSTENCEHHQCHKKSKVKEKITTDYKNKGDTINTDSPIVPYSDSSVESDYMEYNFKDISDTFDVEEEQPTTSFEKGMPTNDNEDYGDNNIPDLINEDQTMIFSDSKIDRPDTSCNTTKSVETENIITKDENKSFTLLHEKKMHVSLESTESKRSSQTLENHTSPDNSKEDYINLSSGHRTLKRSLSESALYYARENPKLDDIPNWVHRSTLWPNKRRKVDEGFEEESNANTENDVSFVQNRRNSISTICHEENVSFCILIDDNCIITEEDYEEEDAVCFADIQDENFNAAINSHLISDNIIYHQPETPFVQDHDNDEVAETLSLDCISEKGIEENWVEDVACVETVVSDNIPEDNDELYGQNRYSSPECEDVFDHTDKIKNIYGDEMCSNDMDLIKTLYSTPQMDVNKTLHDNESLEEFNRQCEHDFVEENSHPAYDINETTSERKSVDDLNLSDVKQPPRFEKFDNHVAEDNLTTFYDDELDKNDSKNLDKNLKTEDTCIKAQDYTVHSCESSVSEINCLNKPVESTKYKRSSSSPEVSSTTSEDKKSGILLKITNYNGSRVSQINSIDLNLTKRIRCKFTEDSDYLSDKSNSTKSRPLITKAAQKYIPPLKETISDLKVKLFLPEKSLTKFKQLKISKETPNLTSPNKFRMVKQTLSNKIIPKKPKPKFEDVLKSIDEVQAQMRKEKNKKVKKTVPKVIIKKSENGSYNTRTFDKESFNPDLTGRKWQPWVFIERNKFIEKMVSRGKTKAVFCHRKNTYIFAERFQKYKSVGSTKFVISQPNSDSVASGPLRYTIKLKQSY